MKRTRLKDRTLPNYTRGEEIMNTVTHITGGGLAVLILLACVIKSAMLRDWVAITAAMVYGVCMVLLYTMSSIYHGLRPGTGKKVLQVLDHCTIYLLIAGSYTAVSLIGLRPAFPILGWGMFVFQWALVVLCVTLTAIDLKKYSIFSMICYIGMGWAIVPFIPQTISALSPAGFYYLLAGGIAYTVGAVLYGIGSKRPWFHAIFHLFVILGSLLQFICIFFYAI